MKESSVSAFVRLARWIACAAVALTLGAGALLAQSTGKIEGRVRDQAGAPIASAQVRINGTAFGAVANAQGYYFINNVPSGVYELVGTFVGYKPVGVAGLRVAAGQTITQDFTLEQTPIEITEITVVGAQNALVPRDQVTTKQTLQGDYVEKLPVDKIQDVLALQPGVVASNGARTITIRGGRTDEAVTYIDGVPVTPGNRGNGFVGMDAGTIAVSPGGFEDASVTTGASSAEFGNAQSGVIAVQTRGGGTAWSGTLGYESDALTGLNNSVGMNRVRLGFGGPITGNLSFYVSGDLLGQSTGGSADFPAPGTAQGFNAEKAPILVSAGIDTTVAVPVAGGTDSVNIYKFAVYRGECDAFKDAGAADPTNPHVADIRNNYGLDCRGGQAPVSPTSTYQASAKLSYTYGTGSRAALSFLRNQLNSRNFSYSRMFGAAVDFDALYTGNNVATLNITQNLSKSAERALALDVYASYQWDRAIEGPLTTSSEQDTRNPWGGFIVKPMDFQFNFDNFPLDQQLVRNFQRNVGRRSPYDLDNTAQYELKELYRNNPYSTSSRGPIANDLALSFLDGGGPTRRLSMYKEDRAIGKANLDWQVDRYNRVKLGGEYTKYYITNFSSQLTSQAFSDAYKEQPTRWNAFVEDRLDLGDLVLVGGLRYDWYKTGASRPYFTDSLGNKSWFPRISTMPGFDASNPDAIMVEDKSHDYVSPHVQVSFPVTERTNFRLSYAHQVQAPDFGLILGGINTDLSVTNTNHFYGSDLDFGKTITFEFGIRHSFSDDMVLDISAYNKDKLSDAAGRLVSFYDPFKQAPVDIRVVTNADFGNARGIDIRFDRRFGELFNGTLAYTFEDAKNTGSDPSTYINFGSRVLNALGGGNNPPPQAILTTDQNRPHNLAGQLALNFPDNWHQGSTGGAIFQNVGVFATFRFASGTPYTRCPGDSGDENVLSGTVCAKRIEGDYNGARLPMLKFFDMKLTKGFQLGGVDLTAYADIRNLFNFRNILQVFTTTNDITSSVERDEIHRGELQDYQNEAAANPNALRTNGDIDLTANSCATWITSDLVAAPPNCIYLQRTEQRYGDGDGVFTVSEQTRAVDALYNHIRGEQNFTGPERRVRLGVELSF